MQHAKWLEGARALSWRKPVPSLNLLLTSTCWRNDHNGFSHQGPGLIDTVVTQRGSVSRVYFPPDAVRRAARKPAGAAELLDHCDEMRARHHDWIRTHFEDLPEVTDWVWSG